MKAIYYDRYGSPDALTFTDMPKPVPKDDEVLVRVHAASINSWDWDMIRGEPIFVRIWGLFKPKHKIPGSDIAGKVEAVGRLIKKFKPGDEVFGDIVEHGWGGFAEYACAHEHQLVLKPASMSYEQAAAIPQAGLLALQSIRDFGQLQKGQRMLLNGAGGSVGTLGVQIAKMLGAEVTAVDSAEKLELLRKRCCQPADIQLQKSISTGRPICNDRRHHVHHIKDDDRRLVGVTDKEDSWKSFGPAC
jgi:NADPH:quinone reductase-like Zn-dependent oxidoreductase